MNEELQSNSSLSSFCSSRSSTCCECLKKVLGSWISPSTSESEIQILPTSPDEDECFEVKNYSNSVKSLGSVKGRLTGNRPRGRGRDMFGSRQKDRSRSRGRDRSKSRGKDRSRSRQKDRSRSRGRDRSRSRRKDRSRSRQKDRSRSRGRDRSRSRGKDRSRSRQKDRSRSRGRDRSRSRGKDRSRSRQKDRARSRGRDRSRRRGKDGSRSRQKDRSVCRRTYRQLKIYQSKSRLIEKLRRDCPSITSRNSRKRQSRETRNHAVGNGMQYKVGRKGRGERYSYNGGSESFGENSGMRHRGEAACESLSELSSVE